jgi:CubicO group peptidase (beta-lactamase class C family)
MRSEELSAFLQQRIDAGDFPSAVYLVAEKGKIVFQDALGFAVIEPEKIPAKVDTIYDVASLTKPLITGLLVAKLVEKSEVGLGDRIGDILPEFYLSSNAEITVDRLLLHTSGLPPWRPFYLLVDDPSEISREIASMMIPEGQEPVTYSDLNFITLAAIVERASGGDLSDISEEVIFDPLHLTHSLLRPLSRFPVVEIAASELGNEHEKRTCREMGYEAPDDKFRDYQIWGEVHDGNAWFMGGMAGHAGLFSTAEEVFRIALQFLPEYTTLLKPETCKLFRTNFTQGMNEARSFAFELAETSKSTAGDNMSPESFGHLGFTGTSLWIDPVRDRVFILLTNRTHHHELPFTNINSVRRRFQNLANERLNEQK